jgi:LAO/AO transport system kinase
VETVGVGQSETTVHSMTDFFLLLLLPGAGDELQGIKRGIVEMADMIAVNKADGDRQLLAKQAKVAYQNALHLFPPKTSGWFPKVVTCSAISEVGIQDAWAQINAYCETTKANGFFEGKRQEQARYWLYETIHNSLNQLFYSNEAVKNNLKAVENAVISGKISSFQGAEQLLNFVVGKFISRPPAAREGKK